MWKIYFRTGLLGGAFAAGMLIPQAAPAAVLVPYLVMLMLGMSFLKSGMNWTRIRRLHFLILAASLILAFAVLWILRVCGASADLAAAGFYIAFTPTAAAAPVIIGMLDGDVEFTAMSTVLTNLAAALLFPLLLIGVNGVFHGRIFVDALMQVGQMVLFPALLTAVCRKRWPEKSAAVSRKLGKYTFYLWICTMFLLCAKSGAFLRASQQSFMLLVNMAVLSGGLCALNFFLGRQIGKRYGMPREGSQCLGQKNTSLTIYLAMTYTSPAAALGPVFYIFFHNFWNACQLQHHQKELLVKGAEISTGHVDKNG